MNNRPEVLIIFPRREGALDGWRRGQGPFPQRSLPLLVLAALARRSGWDARIVDEYRPGRRERPTERLPDLVMVIVWTPLAPRAYQIAEHYRSLGVPVVLGGAHASLLPTEALRHADSIVLGEAESVASALFSDAEAGRLAPTYHGEWLPMERSPSLSEYLDLYRQGPYRWLPIDSIQTSRGCKYNCNFCSVIRINGRGMRHMTTDRVIEDLKILASTPSLVPGGRPVYLVDDDVMSDREYAAELFESIVRSGIRRPLAIQASIGIARDDEVLRLAAAAGCVSIFVGIESVSRDSLLEANKKNRPHEYQELVRRVHDVGIGVSAGIIFGFDHDRPDVFERTVAELDRAEFDTARFGALVPMPGTETFAHFHEDGRILTYDWGHYDAMRCVIQPAQMTPAQLEQGVVEAARRWSSLGARRRRFARQARDVSGRLAVASAASSRRYATAIRRTQATASPAFEPNAKDLALLLTTSRAPASDAIRTAAAAVGGPAAGTVVALTNRPLDSTCARKGSGAAE